MQLAVSGDRTSLFVFANSLQHTVTIRHFLEVEYRLSSFITPEGSKILQIKHLKHKITQQYIQVKTIKTPLKQII